MLGYYNIDSFLVLYFLLGCLQICNNIIEIKRNIEKLYKKRLDTKKRIVRT